MQLHYYIPFKAQVADKAAADKALQDKKLNIAGVAIDSSVNANKWQIPPEDLDFVADGLNNAQLRIDHGESVLTIIGKVSAAKKNGNQVNFEAEVGDDRVIPKILDGYVDHVSIQVDSNDVECSKCQKPTRQDGMLIHLCPDAWEVIHKPKVRELSIVASPAYKNTGFKPIGFGAAMDENQAAEFARVQAISLQKAKLTAKLQLLEIQAQLIGDQRAFPQ